MQKKGAGSLAAVFLAALMVIPAASGLGQNFRRGDASVSVNLDCRMRPPPPNVSQGKDSPNPWTSFREHVRKEAGMSEEAVVSGGDPRAPQSR